VHSENVKVFEQYHLITIPDVWDRGYTLVDSVLNARDESTSVLASASEEKLVAKPTIGIIEQLLDRAYEHVAASVVCFATKNGATAEIAARAAMEASTNVRYILAGDRNSRVLAWLRAFLVQDSKQINNWERALSNHSANEAEVHREGIQRRRRVRENEKNSSRGSNGSSRPSVCIRATKLGPSLSRRALRQ
jgi:hypothetical protein